MVERPPLFLCGKGDSERDELSLPALTFNDF
ncbi:hypothetical protein BREVUG8_110441 [Brevundimonas sp. G8]|nr:hypothetical protein BREVUG8_110441 [Brevundimonas sp. G8]